MARTKSSGSRVKHVDRLFMPLLTVSLLLLAVSGLFIYTYTRHRNTIDSYSLLEKIDNQACRYLYRQPAVNGSFDLNRHAPANEPKLVYKCTNGQVTTAREIHGKNIDTYELGATVMYFSSKEAAERYAENNLNPLRYWGVDQEGQQSGIPQTSRFTFIVSDEPVPYFDAYTVKANAVLRVSLPCPIDTNTDCYDEADSVLKNELKGINVL